jgi:hypothetical protein
MKNVRSGTGGKTGNGQLIHTDIARPHNSRRVQRSIEASRVERLLHPADSPDLAASDFFLFGHIKGKLSDHICKSREELLNAITEIFTGVDQEALLSVFESSASRLTWVIKHDGKYYTK